MGAALTALYDFGGKVVATTCKDDTFWNGLKFSIMATVGITLTMVTDSIGMMDHSLEPRIRNSMAIASTWTFVAMTCFTLFFNLFSVTLYKIASWQICFFALIPIVTFIGISFLRKSLGYKALVEGETLSTKRRG
jgi:hypothetical protein